MGRFDCIYNLDTILNPIVEIKYSLMKWILQSIWNTQKKMGGVGGGGGGLECICQIYMIYMIIYLAWRY